MTNARALGQDDLATMLAQKVIKLYEDTPVYYNGPFDLTVAYAALGDNDKALHNFQQVPGSALSSIPLVELFRLNDPEGPYSGISSDIAFKQTLEKIRIENEAILRRVAKEMPDLLDPASRL